MTNPEHQQHILEMTQHFAYASGYLLGAALVKSVIAEEALTQATIELEEAVQKQRFDDLTGLLSKSGLVEQATEQLAVSENIGVIFFDLTNFKKINDSFGHHVGDQYLINAAGIISANVRANDLVGRWAGDEFIVVFDTTPRNDDDKQYTTAERIQIIINRIQESFELSLAQHGFAGQGLGISAGYDIFGPQAHGDIEGLISAADLKQYENKEVQHARLGKYRST